MAKILSAVALVAITVIGFALGEFLLAGPIVFLVELLGFWLGYVAFCLIWGGIGLFVLAIWDRFIGRSRPVEKTGKGNPRNWRERLVLRIARAARSLGTLAAMMILGPVFAWAIFKLLGYRKCEVYALTIASAWTFGALWVPFYGLGVWGLGLSRVF